MLATTVGIHRAKMGLIGASEMPYESGGDGKLHGDVHGTNNKYGLCKCAFWY
jgi:hypothetical protein